jgi:recombination protein RecT
MTKTQTASTSHLANAITQKQSAPAKVDPYRQAQAYLKAMEPAIKQALPQSSGMSPERLCRITLTTLKQNVNLLNCSIESLLGAVLQSAQLGLEPNLLGSCYFIPYKNTVSFQIGYKGLIDLATRKGEVKTIVANPVYENDLFEIEYGLSEVFRHKPAKYNERGKLVGFYAYAHLKNGGFKAEYMDIEEVEKIRNEHSISYRFDKTGSIWVKHYEAMAIKTVIKKLIKYLPISVETQNAIAHDETVRKDITEEAIRVDITSDGMEEVESFPTEIIDKQEEK